MSKEEFKYKQVIAIRIDLEMGKGKLAVQVSHAAVSAVEETRHKRPKWLQAWLKEGQCKVAVKVKGLAELLYLQKEAAQMELPNSLITDRGLTQLPPNTVTCLGIGPAPSSKIDKITGKLPLL
jgi:PTH2 family peptidyl-tRNA hydrolase